MISKDAFIKADPKQRDQHSHRSWLSNKPWGSRVWLLTGDTSFGKTEKGPPSLFKERDGGFTLFQMEFNVRNQ